MLVAHAVVAAIFNVEPVAAALVFQGLAAGAVLAVVGVDFVERGGKGFFEGEFGVFKVGFGAAVFPVHGAPVEEGQVEADAAAQYRHVEQVFAVFGRGAKRGIQRDAGIPAAVLRLLAFEGGLQAVVGGDEVGAGGEGGDGHIQIKLAAFGQAEGFGLHGHCLAGAQVEQIAQSGFGVAAALLQ